MNWQNGGEFILFHPFQLKKQDGHFFCQHWALVHSPPHIFGKQKNIFWPLMESYPISLDSLKHKLSNDIKLFDV